MRFVVDYSVYKCRKPDTLDTISLLKIPDVNQKIIA